ncbi:hypothetical protein BGZ49_007600 [Haplosporangium sp. Z 27]|nr:hypothetical protein BGZ49_007600 [Haplosporangium sp. Z 27]
MPLLATSIPETARGFLGSLRLRTNALFTATSPAHHPSSVTTTASSTSSSTSSASFSTYSPSLVSPISPYARSNPASSHTSSGSSPNLPVRESKTEPEDFDIKLEMPNKRRFEPGFPFQFKSRNNSSGSLFSTLSASLKQSHQKLSRQQPHQEKSHLSKPMETQQEPAISLISQSYPAGALEAAPLVTPFIPPRNQSRVFSKGKGAMQRLQQRGVNQVNNSVSKFDRSTKLKAKSRKIEMDSMTISSVIVETGADYDIENESDVDVKRQNRVVQPQASTFLNSSRPLPEAVIIRDLPEYYPGDYIGLNIKRNEAYANIRLLALREHQRSLVQLLGDLLDVENLYRQNQIQVQNQSRNRYLPACPLAALNQPESCQCDCSPGTSTTPAIKPVIDHFQQLQSHELVVNGFKKAIIDLWQVDQNMCYWLGRYIRMARRIGRSLDFMLAEVRETRPSSQGHDVSGNTEGSLEGHDDLRMSVLMSKLLDYSLHNHTSDAMLSSTLPRLDEDVNTTGESSHSEMHSYPKTKLNVSAANSPLESHSHNDDFIFNYQQESLFATPTESHIRCSPVNERGTNIFTLPSSDTFTATPTVPAVAVLPPSPLEFQVRGSSLRYLTPNDPNSSHPSPLSPPPPPPSPIPYPIVSALPLRLRPSPNHDEQQQQRRVDENQKQPSIRFQDLDDVEASIFVGSHMQSLEKSNEFLKQFNNESNRSRVIIEKFKAAKDVYDRRLNKQPLTAKNG